MIEGARDSVRPPQPAASWLSVALLLGPLSILAELLIERTHHRPLGAVTFAIIGVALWLGAELVNRRLLDPTMCASRARNRKVAWIGGALLSAAVLVRALL